MATKPKNIVFLQPGQGRSPIWDFDAGQDDSRYYRGKGNYNGRAFSHLSVPED